jgi:hypothetical protein
MIKKSAINKIIFSIPGQTSTPINTNVEINLRIIAKTMIWKKLSGRVFSKNELSNPIRKDKMATNRRISQIFE